jgi:hypothetical protein
VCGLPQMCVCHIITGDKNRPVVKVLFPLHILFELTQIFHSIKKLIMNFDTRP